MEKYLAKSFPPETIVEHTTKVLEQLKLLKRHYPDIRFADWDILELACTYHDCGKMNTKFQNKLYQKLYKRDFCKDEFPEIPEIQHGYLSASFLPFEELKKRYANYPADLKMLYQIVYYHHSRPENSKDDIKTVVEYELKPKLNTVELPVEVKKLRIPSSKYIGIMISNLDNDDEQFYKFVINKGLLNKVDYAASTSTADIKVEIKNDDLFQRVDEFFDGQSFKPNDLQNYTIAHQNDNNVIIASTGIGKTEAALYWIGNNKGFFTLPLKVSNTAIYDRIIDKINFKNTGLLHSSTYDEYWARAENNEVDAAYLEMTKQMSLPLTVCTLDQLIDFVFLYRGFEVKLATLSYSKLVIDEIQMYDPVYIGYLLVALYHVNNVGGRFCILTATLPGIITDFLDKLEIKYEKPAAFLKKDCNGEVQKRHRIKILEKDISIEEIKTKIQKSDAKVLIIVNTVKKAQEIFSLFKKDENLDFPVQLLHGRFIQKDRKQKEMDIIRLGDKNCKGRGIWITTQIVEASLDIDFDVLFTELSDLSGLFQRMGRVFRNRPLEDEKTNIFVFVSEEDGHCTGVGTGSKAPIQEEIFNMSKELLLEKSDGIINEEEKIALVEILYSGAKIKNTEYYRTIKETVDFFKTFPAYEAEKTDANLRNIKTKEIIPLGVYEENQSEIEALVQILKKQEKDTRRALMELRQFVLSIPIEVYHKEERSGNISKKIEVNKYSVISVLKCQYDFEIGLLYLKRKEEFDSELQFF